MRWVHGAANNWFIDDPGYKIVAVITCYLDRVEARLHDVGTKDRPRRALLLDSFATEKVAMMTIEHHILRHLWAEPGAF